MGRSLWLRGRHDSILLSFQGFKGKTGHPGLPGPKVRVTSAKQVFSAVLRPDARQAWQPSQGWRCHLISSRDIIPTSKLPEPLKPGRLAHATYQPEGTKARASDLCSGVKLGWDYQAPTVLSFRVTVANQVLLAAVAGQVQR